MRRHDIPMPEDEENEINLTPMLDVVFILLIFFIVTASFIKEVGLDVNRPDNQQQQQVKQEEANILVVIDRNTDAAPSSANLASRSTSRVTRRFLVTIATGFRNSRSTSIVRRVSSSRRSTGW